MSLAAGTRLGGYEILASLGAGGMGEVYRAKDPRLGREVALKVLADHLVRDEGARARFEREARAVAALAHPGIVAIHDFGVEHGLPWAAMELLEGETLRARLGAARLPRRRALEVGVALAEALATAHARGIVHRDLKPENVFLTTSGHVKLLDFGLARELPVAEIDTEAPTAAALTREGTVLGTFGYMAPEQLRGQPADHRSDVFALGCVLYEMLTGQRPFTGVTAADMAGAVLRDDPKTPSSLAADVSPTLDRVVARCLSKDPEHRFQSARDLALDLGAILDEAPARRSDPPSPAAVPAVAVLPFENVGGSADDEYLSDGLTESVLFSLSGRGGLRVMSRASVFRYKGRNADPRVVGRDLGVDAVLTGRLRQHGEQLGVDVELVDVEGGWLLWGERYDRRPDDLLRIQDEIATQATAHLRRRGGEDTNEPSRRPTENTEAYRLYLQGRHEWNKRTAESMRRAIELFQGATGLDPTYALAYAGMADSYALLERYGVLPPADVMPRAKAAALRALESDPELAEAHASLAIVATYYDWDWPAAERGFRRALELKPGYATAHHWFAWYLSAMSRHPEAWEQIQQARALDPLSPIINANVGTVLYFARRFDEAVRSLRGTLAVEPGFVVARQWLGRALEQVGLAEEAIAEHRVALERLGEDSEGLASLGHALAGAGQEDEARRLLARLEALSERRFVPSYWRALVHTGLGDHDRAFHWLHRALEERFDWLIFLTGETAFDSLRSDPRFSGLVGRVGLPTLPPA